MRDRYTAKTAFHANDLANPVRPVVVYVCDVGHNPSLVFVRVLGAVGFAHLGYDINEISLRVFLIDASYQWRAHLVQYHRPPPLA